MVFFKKNNFLILLLGFSSGVPFLLTLSTLTFWLSELTTPKRWIGFLMLTGLPYSLKCLWAPVLERFRCPILGKRLGPKKGWGLCAQLFMMGATIALGYSEPDKNIFYTGFLAFLLSFSAATQDIIIDCLRIEITDESNAGFAASAESVGFRLGMVTSGAGALYLAAYFSWSVSYLIMALSYVLGMAGMILIKENNKNDSPSTSLYKHIIYSLEGLKNNYSLPYLLSFIFFFKFSDIILNSISPSFFHSLGFSKIEYAHVSKFFGILMTLIGGIVAGGIIHQVGIIKTIFFSVVMQIISSFMFFIQSFVGYNLHYLTFSVGIESFSSGISSTVFIVCLSAFCKHPFTTTHFTFLYSFGSLCRVILSMVANFHVEYFSFSSLFFLSALFTVPVFFLTMRLRFLYHTPQKNCYTREQKRKFSVLSTK